PAAAGVVVRSGQPRRAGGPQADHHAATRAGGAARHGTADRARGVALMFARRESPLLVWITVLIAVVLTLLPLPQAVSIFWPNLVLLAVLYWSTMAPAIGGVLVGFASGLALDVLGGAQLGQHAFAFSVLTYLAIKLHLLTRSKPIFEQAN